MKIAHILEETIIPFDSVEFVSSESNEHRVIMVHMRESKKEIGLIKAEADMFLKDYKEYLETMGKIASQAVEDET